MPPLLWFCLVSELPLLPLQPRPACTVLTERGCAPGHLLLVAGNVLMSWNLGASPWCQPSLFPLILVDVD